MEFGLQTSISGQEACKLVMQQENKWIDKPLKDIDGKLLFTAVSRCQQVAGLIGPKGEN